MAFGEGHAAVYDQRSAKIAAMHEVLHLLIGAVLADLPADARILCVGAGTGAELLYLARKFPGWHFTAVEPSAPMLMACRRKVEEFGLTPRCVFHEGYLNTLPASEAFDAATSLNVSHFILDPDARVGFFHGIAERLRPGGYLVSSDLASDTASGTYESLFGVWARLMRETGSSAEQLEQLRIAYGRDVAMLPKEQVSSIIAAGGFETPVLFLQTCLIHAWFALRIPAGA